MYSWSVISVREAEADPPLSYMKRKIFIALGILAAIILVVFLEVDLHTREVFKTVRKFDANYSLDVKGNKHIAIILTEFIPVSLKEIPSVQKKGVYCYCVDTSAMNPELAYVDPGADSEKLFWGSKDRTKIKCVRLGERKTVDQFSVPANYSGQVLLEEKENFFRIEYYGWTHWHFTWWFLDGELLFSMKEYFDH
ncbi:hypothetical protein MCEMSE15_02491 [Fimbriimonadaceae bacterium]